MGRPPSGRARYRRLDVINEGTMIPSIASRLIAAAGLLLLAAGPASAADKYAGTSTGEPGRCAPFNFEITVDNGKITGGATTLGERGRTNAWNVEGTVTGAGAVQLMTERKGSVGDQSLTKTNWSGKVEGGVMSLSQRGSVLCAAPRTIALRKQ